MVLHVVNFFDTFKQVNITPTPLVLPPLPLNIY